MKHVLLILFWVILVISSQSKNLLFLNGMASKSHHFWNRVLMEALAKKGHNLTIVSADIDDVTPPANMHYIHLEKVYSAVHDGPDAINLIDIVNWSPISSLLSIPQYCSQNCDGILSSVGLENILNYPSDFKFDAVLYDFTCGPCLLPLLHKFNYPPLISMTAFNNPSYTVHLISGHKWPNFVPHYITDYPRDMTFIQRFNNLVLYFIDYMVWKYSFIPELDKKIRKLPQFKDVPHLRELEERTKIVLVNSDNSVDFAEPFEPKIIQVGGLQIKEPEELPDDLKNFIENGKKGTVLMSLGTNINSNMLGDNLLVNIFKTFENLPDYNFIWKFESDPSQLPLKPSKNVLIKRFLPQNDILAHPKIKAFITHGGLLSTHEALWHGKPMIGIAIFCDQKRNVARSVELGASIKVNLQSFDRDNFTKTIESFINDPSYAENAQKLSRLFRDKPQKPLETAIWWIEYVTRNPKMEHLKLPKYCVNNLGHFASNCYDLLLTFIILVCAVTLITVKIVRMIFKLTVNRKIPKDIKKIN